MPIRYCTNEPISSEQLAALFVKSGIQRPTDDLVRLQRMIDSANLTVTAWDGGKLVGVARALTDFVWCCYVSDLAVDQDYQHQGVGRELLRQIQAQIENGEATLLLLSAPEAMEYYPKVGLQPIQNGWMIKRTK